MDELMRAYSEPDYNEQQQSPACFSEKEKEKSPH